MKIILKEIEERRFSKNPLWKIAVILKDFSWRVIKKVKDSRYKAREYKRRSNTGKLPDFLIIGVQKGGTTWLWQGLKSHPSIEMSPNYIEKRAEGKSDIKEVHFFSNRKKWQKGIDWYCSLFNKNNKLQGEATPEYILSNEAHIRMSRVIPHAKLILLLRDPVTRAYSNFNHIRQEKPSWAGFNESNKSFEENLRREIRFGFKRGSIFGRGFYINQIEHLLKFYPRNQLLILISERMKKNPKEVYDKVCEFLGISKVNLKLRENIHKRAYDQPMKKSTEKFLYALYKPYNERLFKFLGYRIPEWGQQNEE